MFADKREAIFVGVIDMMKGKSNAKILISLSEKEVYWSSDHDT